MKPSATLQKGALKYPQKFRMFLLWAFKDTLLPEIYAICGTEKFLEFVDCFSGKSLYNKVPTSKELMAAGRKFTIYTEMSSAPENIRSTVSHRLASDYFLGEPSIRLIYKQVSEILDAPFDMKKLKERLKQIAEEKK